MKLYGDLIMGEDCTKDLDLLSYNDFAEYAKSKNLDLTRSSLSVNKLELKFHYLQWGNGCFYETALQLLNLLLASEASIGLAEGDRRHSGQARSDDCVVLDS
jgi:hypothetical protein